MRRALAYLVLAVLLVPTVGMGVRACFVECPMAEAQQPALASAMTHCPMAEGTTSESSTTVQRQLPDCCTLSEVPAEPPTLPFLPTHEAAVSLAAPTLLVATLPASVKASEQPPVVPPPRVPIFRLQRSLLL